MWLRSARGAFFAPLLGVLAATPALAEEGPLALSLAEALELAAARSHAVARARMDVESTDTQVKEARSAVYPRVDASVRYTRTFETPNPFAGSGASGILGGLFSVNWLEFNERARSDADPTTNPVTFDEFIRRQNEGLAAAGIEQDPDANPFLVENELAASLSINQVLYNGAAFAALDGAEAARSQVAAGVEVEALRTVDQASRAYLGTLLADARVAVLEASVGRVEESLEDTRRLVAQGVEPQFQQLTAEVELANLETQRIQATDAAESAREGMLLLLDLPAGRELKLTDALHLGTAFSLPSVDRAAALKLAREQRPDLRQLRLAMGSADLQAEVARAAFEPVLSAFANLSYIGRVPDNRETTVSDPMDPFAFSKDEKGIFDSSYWNANITAGLSLSWNLFAGYADEARVERAQVQRRQIEDAIAALDSAIAVEVDQAVRAIETAAARIRTQEKNLARADQAYEHARARVREGVSTRLELRQASQQLDETRFNHLQAVHDYLVAYVRYEVAVGQRPGTDLPIAPAGAPAGATDEGAAPSDEAPAAPGPEVQP
ncbi:MAG: TolC family protein [Myxococcales bacterium]|nr:TolC family protein [Myxococcales bacterium]